MMATRADFIARFGGVYECSAWVAERAAAVATAADDDEAVAGILADCVDNATTDEKLALIRAHPDLADRARVADGLTEESAEEQASAGLDRCSAEEFVRFEALNRAYWHKFGFPFVMAVREKSRGEILESFETRLDNDPATEFETAIAEIHEIARLRIGALGDG